MKTRIYIAGPLSTGNLVSNIKPAIEVANELIRRGFAVFCPHLSHFNELFAGESIPWEEWLTMDESWISVSHAVLRIGGPSRGADREVAFAHRLGIPVFYQVQNLVRVAKVLWGSGLTDGL